MIKDGVITTPPQAAAILDGINRKSCMQIARDLGYELIERDLARAELALADEVFMTGTAAELTPLVEIDDIRIGTGAPGPVTREIQGVFEDALWGREPRYADWLDLVRVPSPYVNDVKVHWSMTRPCVTACRARGCRSRPTRRCASRTRSTTSAST